MLKKNDAPYDFINKSVSNHKNLNVIKLNSFKAIDEFVKNAQKNQN
jgi:hypothetical protein